MAARLTVVGTGIQSGRDFSPQALHRIKTAEKVFFLLADPVTALWLTQLNNHAESLGVFYSPKKRRIQTYKEMTDRIVSFVERGADVCVVTYGHPGVSVYATHKAIERAKAMGVEATMMPAVSSIDCLIADLGVDPATRGFAVFDATDFLFFRHRYDPNSSLVLTQIAVTAQGGYKKNGAYGRNGLQALIAKLVVTYGRKHRVVIYEASPYPVAEPSIQWIALEHVPTATISETSTLYVPPRGVAPVDEEMLRRVRVE